VTQMHDCNGTVVFKKMEEITANCTTSLAMEQNARMALEYADRGYVFQIGEIFLEDKAENLLENEEMKSRSWKRSDVMIRSRIRRALPQQLLATSPTAAQRATALVPATN